MSTEQSVAGTNEQKNSASEGNDSAQDDLDTLLSQYETETKKPEPEAKGGQTDDTTVLREQLSQLVYERDMGKVIPSIRGSLDANEYNDEMVDEWVNLQAKKDPRITQAWLNRKADSGTFQKVMNGLGKKFQSRYSGKPAGPSGNELEAAVRSSSETTPTKETRDDFARQLGKMSNTEFNKQWADWGIDG